VRVTLNGPVANPPTAVTDIRGAFEVTDVPPGSYSMTAARAGYLTVQYGQRRPREAGRTLEVREGQVVENVDFALPRGAVLAGRIVDELGDPAPGVRVEAMDLRYIRGRRILVQAALGTTNDIGQFRISGLEPGTYYVRASTIETWESDDGKETYAYAHTFYPGVAAMDQTRQLTLAVGQELASLDFSLVSTRAARISGVLLNAGGDPIVGQRINLDRITRGVGGGLFSAGFGGNTISGRDGSFEIRNLAPGEYVLYSGNQESEQARLPITVTEGDVQGIVLTPRRASSVSGSVVTDEGTPPDFPAGRMRLSPIAIDEVLPIWGTPSVQAVRPDWTFRINNIDGSFLFRPTGMPDEWMLKAVRAGERDITDIPIDIPRGGSDTAVRIVISRSAGKVSGQVVAADGAPTADSTIVVFASDSRLWGPGTRFVKAVRPNSEGRFVIGGLPPGAYRAIARDFVVDGQWDDPEFLRSASPHAVSFDLIEGGSITVNLKVENQP
jgi:hypothetical protein